MSLKWKRPIQDGSSRATCSIFDFNCDGIMEVVYRDEVNLYVYDGPSGLALDIRQCGSGTRNEYPVIVDVDGDGQANIVCNCSTRSIGQAGYVTAFTSTSGNWPPTRKVMNQHNYSVVNINDDLTVPCIMQNSAHAGIKQLNSFLNQAPFFDENGHQICSSIFGAAAGPDILICEGQSTILYGGHGDTYKWVPAEGLNDATLPMPEASPTAPTTYIVTVTRGNCSDNDTVMVTPIAKPIISVSGNVTILSGQTTILFVKGASNYSWSPNTAINCNTCDKILANPATTTIYYVTTKGCEVKDSIEVYVETKCNELFVPNAFSPNGDGNNDVLYVRGGGTCIKDFSFIIFDRWGEKVFETTDLKIGWKGIYKEQEMLSAVFVYSLNTELANGKITTLKGTVSLIK